MNVGLITHASCMDHQPGAGHPESMLRLGAVLDALDGERFALLLRLAAAPATREQLLRAHSPQLVAQILAPCPPAGQRRIDHDTVMSEGSAAAALHAAGAVCMGVDAVMSGELLRVFCAVRPPGHHATRTQAMGFCLFNSIAVGAAHALDAHGLERIAIVDFDVHHGNGTEDIFARDPRVLFVSSHQWPLYPGTGAAQERGIGNRLNLPLPPGSGSAQFRAAWREQGLPAIEAFAPQLILVSAGFDAHRLDPLAGLDLEASDYDWITRELVGVAERHAQGRLVSTLEGGYSLTALRQCSAAHVAALFP